MDPLAQLLGESPGIVSVRDQVLRLLRRQSDARRMPTIILQAETGTGKGLLARAMHRGSARASGPFVDVNCAAIPETLLEAEMFGVERGAFTDARQSRPGLFQLAHQGTIFLDEIGLLPDALQAKLLKVIEERAVRRLGGTRTVPVDVWVIAATNEDLAAAVRMGTFRADLYHRLAVVTLSLPPLRERGDDVLLLAEHFLAAACKDYDVPTKTLTAAARHALRAYNWPGNVRELSNVLERTALLSDGPQVTPEALALPAAAPTVARADPTPPPTLRAAVHDVERERLLEALAEVSWNITHAAIRLGISRNTLRYRIEKHGLRRETAGRRPADRSAPAPAAGAPATAPIAAARERRRLTLLRAVLVPPPTAFDAPLGDRALDVLSDKVQTFGGRVEKVDTTGLVAVFGLEPVEDATVRAAHTARAVFNAVERLRQTGSTNVAVSVAIHVDYFLIAPGSAASPIDVDVQPHVWAVLDALLAGAPPDSVVASEAAVPFLERCFDLVPGAVGGGAPRRAWQITGFRRSGFGRGGRIASFVGRQHELELLRSRFDSAARGQGQIAGIAGDAGIGKSRLLHEFRQTLAAERVTFLEGHCVSYGSAVPYLPILDLVRGLCGLLEADSPDTVAEKVSTVLANAGLDAAASAPYVLHLLGFKEGAERLAARSPDEVKRRIFETLNTMLWHASARRPLAFLLEDLHWIDTTSEEYLSMLAGILATAHIVLVVTYRSGYRAKWIDRSYATQIALQPLLREHGRSVVRAILDPGAVDDAVVEAIVARAEGNPFFLEELARAVREQGGQSPDLRAPDTVQEVLLARINRLLPDDKTLLQAAAVIGKDVPFSLLRGIADRPEEELRRQLTDLTAAEFLLETTAAGELEYTFKHTLTHEVAEQGLGHDLRCALNVRIVEAIERMHTGRLFEQVERLAHHAFRGEIWDKALLYLRQAGAKAAARSAHSEAVICFSRALDALGHLPESREREEQAVDLHLLLANSLIPIAELTPILDHLREAERRARALGDRSRVGRVWSFLSAYFWLVGDHELSVEHGLRAREIATDVDSLSLRVRTNLSLGQAYHVLGAYRNAIEAFERNVDELGGDLLARRFGLVGVPSVLSRAWMVWCFAELGEFERALPRGDEAIRIAEAVGDPYSILAAYFGMGGLHLRRGERDRAVAVLERALELCQRWDTQLQLWFMGVAPSLGHAYALAGKASQAVPLLEQALQQAATTKLMFAQSLRTGWLVHAYLHAGRLADARRLAPEALALARRHRERGHEAWIQGIIGEIAVHDDSGDMALAEDAYREAMRIADDLGMRPRVALGHLGLGRLYRRAGKQTEAWDHLDTAVAMLREMQMPLWLEEANAELSALGARR